MGRGLQSPAPPPDARKEPLQVGLGPACGINIVPHPQGCKGEMEGLAP